MPDVLENLPVHERYITAGSETVSVAVLEQLAIDESDRVRRRVAENPHTPEHLLIRLATDSDCEVRLSVTEHSATPAFVLEFLALDSCADVRFGIAENPDAPRHILSMLAQDHNPFVAHRARKTIGALSPNTNGAGAA
jgi:hypothetical protein